jgi:hypothetical protein
MGMKRFVLFAGEHYYAKGGAADLVGSFDTLEQARAALDSETTERWGDQVVIADAKGDVWWHIYDQVAGGIVDSSRSWEKPGAE